MNTLNRKLLRDLWALKLHIAGISVVIAAGVMTLVVALTSLSAIRASMEQFYSTHRLADIWVSLVRAPDPTIEKLENLAGIYRAESRIVASIRLDVPGYGEPVRALAVSIPDGRQPFLNRLFLLTGQLPEADRIDQMVISAQFAEAHGLHPGDQLTAIIKGRTSTFRISGVGLSPEFVYQVGPDQILPDFGRFTVLWMNHSALASAFGMDGAFNSVVLGLAVGAEPEAVIEHLDAMLLPYGSIGAFNRSDLISNRILQQEIGQLRVMAVILPALFLGISAFLLSLLMGRIVKSQRQQIAVLKAFGYRNYQVGVHYAGLTALIILFGFLIGWACGVWAGQAMAALYAEYFRFPYSVTDLDSKTVLYAFGVTALAGGFGVSRGLSEAVRLPPAEAMRPPVPEVFGHSFLGSLGASRASSQASRIILRNLTRHPLKSMMIVLGIAMSTSLFVLGGFQFNAVQQMIDIQYRKVAKMDTHVSFSDPISSRAIHELSGISGIQYAEGYRQVIARVSNGLNSERNTILGLPSDSIVRGLIDRQGNRIVVPKKGLLMTRILADKLELKVGEKLEIQILEGSRRSVSTHLADVVDEPVGMGMYMQIDQLNALMREAPSVSGAWLMTDEVKRLALYKRLNKAPHVSGISSIAEAEQSLRRYFDSTMLSMMGNIWILAGSLAFALAFTNSEIAFSERARVLATLRVLGFSRIQTSWVLVGEVLFYTLLAVPLGWLLGTAFSWALSVAVSLETLRIPFSISRQTYAASALGILLINVIPIWVTVHRVNELELVAALKGID